MMCTAFFRIYLVLPTDEVPSAQPYPQAYLQSCEPYTNEPPPSYDALYTATPPDPQAIQVSFCININTSCTSK